MTENKIEKVEAYRVNGKTFFDKEDAEIELMRQDLIDMFMEKDNIYNASESATEMILENIVSVYKIIKRIFPDGKTSRRYPTEDREGN